MTKLLIFLLVLSSHCCASAFNGCGNGVLDLNEECERNYDCGSGEACNALCTCINPLTFGSHHNEDIVISDSITCNGDKECEISSADISDIY